MMKFHQFRDADLNNLVGNKSNVLSGIVQTIGINLNTAKVIVLATGTKNIDAEKLSPDALPDTHAEVVARRSLLFYFYQQLEIFFKSSMHLFFSDIIFFIHFNISFSIRFYCFSNTQCIDFWIFPVWTWTPIEGKYSIPFVHQVWQFTKMKQKKIEFGFKRKKLQQTSFDFILNLQ